MYKELADDIGCVRQAPHLQDWAREGVLLLNTVLTVIQVKQFSHRDIGWETFLMKLLKQCLISKNMLSLFVGETCTAKNKAYRYI